MNKINNKNKNNLFVKGVLKSVRWEYDNEGKLIPHAIVSCVIDGKPENIYAHLHNKINIENLPVLYEEKRCKIFRIYDNWEEIVYIPFDRPILCIEWIQDGDTIKDAFSERSQGEMEILHVKSVDTEQPSGFYITDELYEGEWYPFEDNRYYFMCTDTNLCIGDTVLLTNKEEPLICAIHHHDSSTVLQHVDRPDICPLCGNELLQKSDYLYCTNKICPSRKIGLEE